jgi:superfamily II DNA or RNA helicase
MMTTKAELYPHNQRTYDRIIEAWKTSNKVAVVQATGTGKSYLILQSLYDHRDQPGIVLAPSNYILDQLNSKFEREMPNLQLMTYAKLSTMDEERISNLHPALIVLDEFHRCGAETWGKGVRFLVDTFPDAKILGTTATPIRYLDGARDMSDELFDGNVAHTLTLPDAIAQGILPTPKIVIGLYTFDEEAESLHEKIERSSNDEASKAALHREVERLKRQLDRSKGIPQILKKHAPGAGKYIVFCKDKAHLHEIRPTVVEWFKNATGRVVETYSVLHVADDNDQQHAAFRDNQNTDNVRLMFSIEMYNEGVHIDDVTGVVLLRPTVSPIIYYQQIGRALQAGNRQQPLIFDFVNNRANIRTGDLEKDVNASIKREKERRRITREKDFNIPVFTVYDETLDALEMFEELGNKLTDDFDANLELLKIYLETNGEYPKQSTKLGSWVSNVRQSLNGRGTIAINQYRQLKLEEINFVWNTIDDAWKKKFEELKAYINTHNQHPTQSSPLGRWVQELRNVNRGNRTRQLSENQIELLNSIGFVWNPHETTWLKNYKELLRFKELHGHTLVSNNYEVNGLRLGGWVEKQRYKFKRRDLSPDRIKLLENIGFVWEVGIGQRPKLKRDL